jgi:hypothetical protein
LIHHERLGEITHGRRIVETALDFRKHRKLGRFQARRRQRRIVKLCQAPRSSAQRRAIASVGLGDRRIHHVLDIGISMLQLDGYPDIDAGVNRTQLPATRALADRGAGISA